MHDYIAVRLRRTRIHGVLAGRVYAFKHSVVRSGAGGVVSPFQQ